jgi:hypothetical protein
MRAVSASRARSSGTCSCALIPLPRMTLRYGSLWKPSTSSAVYVSCVSKIGVHDCPQLVSNVSIPMLSVTRVGSAVKHPCEFSRATQSVGLVAEASCTRLQTLSQLRANDSSNCVLCCSASVRAFAWIELDR